MKVKKSKLLVLALFGLCICIECLGYRRGESKVWKEEEKNYQQEFNDGKKVGCLEPIVTHNNREKKEKVAYLTFDDGPSNTTKQVLDVLEKYQIHGTFFLIGENIQPRMCGVLERMVRDGNQVGIHTYCHEANVMYGNFQLFQKDFLHAEACIQNTIHRKTVLFRFPWGSANDYLCGINNPVCSWLESQGYTYCDWNVSGEDAVGTPTAWSIYHNVEKDFKRYDEAIILLHDSASTELTAKVLPEIIEMIQAAGYRFDTLDHAKHIYQYGRE